MRSWRLRLNIVPHISSHRQFSTGAALPERVDVRCGSAGSVSIDLMNVSDNQPTNVPLLVHLPSFPSQHKTGPQIPTFLHRYQVASINYRWSPFSASATESEDATPAHWPTPIHDASFAFAWILENLSPPKLGRRDIYVYGSYLGASLATSLALTEAHTHARVGVRGFIAYNGIYNWTMFLPDHRVNKPPRRAKIAPSRSEPVEGTHLHCLKERLPALFRTPSDLFDPFASPSLFFHSPGLIVPRSFFMTVEHAALIDNMTSDDEIPEKPTIKVPRKSHLVFPPRQSTLKIPEALLLFDSATLPELTSGGKRKSRTSAKTSRNSGNSFETQATELADLMRRSIDVVELKERSRWDEDWDSEPRGAARRIEVFNAGPESHSTELGDAGQDAADVWLSTRT